MGYAGIESSLGGYMWIFVTLIVGITIQVLVYVLSLLRSAVTDIPVQNEAPLDIVKEKTSGHHQVKQTKKKHATQWKPVKTSFEHQYLATNLMGHTGKILGMDCSSDGKYLVTCAEDRSVFFWDIKDLLGKGRKSLRINIEYDHASHIAWSPDAKAFIIHKGVENCFEVYKVEKKKDGLPLVTSKAFTFENAHSEDVVGVGIACNGRFMMSCSSKNDMIIWALKGEQMARIDTYLMTTMKAKISPCARYVVASGFVGDVKIWEVLFDKMGKFKTVVRAFELSGHTSGVYDFAFDSGTAHIATVSKDGTWKLFNTNIDYVRGEMIQLISTGCYSQCSSAAFIALSPAADIVVVASGKSLEIFNAATGKLCETIENVCAERINGLQFHPTGKYLFAYGEHRIRVFHNISVY